LVGIIAIILTSFSIVPQIVKIYRTKSAKDLSMIQCILLLIGILCWLLYGIQINDLVVIVANAINLLLQIILVSMKKIYDSREYKSYRRYKWIS